MDKLVCIPTYNRSETILELLIRYKDIYKELGFVLYVYDSSDDDKTYKGIEKYIDNEWIFYFRIQSDVHSNEKVFQIYRDFTESKYDYIWVQSDSIRWSEDSLKRITQEINEEKYDFIIPNYRDVEKLGDKIFHDKNAFFEDCAWHMTLYGATIVKKCVFDNADWDYVSKKYLIEDRINFSHVGLFFEQIYKMKMFCALHISLPQDSLTSSLYKKNPGWEKNAFFIHCSVWPNVINALPKFYSNKNIVIKKQGINSNELTKEGLKKYRVKGILNYRTYKEYRVKWKYLTNVNDLTILLYSILPMGLLLLSDEKYKFEKRIKKKLKIFCDKYDDIYVYGCGDRANIYADYLDDMGIQYEGFIISEGKKDKSELRGKKVSQYDSSIALSRKNGIIIATNKMNAIQIKENIMKDQCNAGIFYYFD